MTDALSLATWWKAAEVASSSESPAAAPMPPWAQLLLKAQVAQLRIRLDEAAELLGRAEAQVPEGPWRRVWTLLSTGVRALRSEGRPLEELSSKIEEFARTVPATEPETAARAWHLLCTLRIRANRYQEAEDAAIEALKRVEEAPRRTWILDSFGQILLSQGAWEEGRRTLRGVLERKRGARDPVGVAITVGHLALVDLGLGAFGAVEESLRTALRDHERDLAANTRVRLRTMLLQALLETGRAEEAAREAAQVKALLSESGLQHHYLGGYAALALAREAHASGRAQEAQEWLRRCGEAFTLPDQLALRDYWTERLTPGSPDGQEWMARMEALFLRIGTLSEAEVLTRLYVAERTAREGRRDEARRQLDLVSDRALESGSRLWMERIDRAYREFDAQGFAARLLTRFSGRGLEELQRTVKEDVTIIFADLVNFTPRAQEMAPEQVMQTVRGLFELTVSLLHAHQVRPITYMGDGLLAVCQGDGHRARGLRFAQDLVRKAARVSLVRETLGDRWKLELRAGVASGSAVLGVLGSLQKLEYAAIGMTTNLAARLQGQANPGEVVCAYETAGAAAAGGREESLELKGFSAKVRAVRFTVGA